MREYGFAAVRASREAEQQHAVAAHPVLRVLSRLPRRRQPRT